MFDKLIESDSVGADFKNRRSYFMVSSLIVGVLFATAVVISIYAADVGLGTDDFELSTIVAPPVMPEVIPEPLQPTRPNQSNKTKSEMPMRQVNMPPVDEPGPIPDTTSVKPNTQMERPKYGDFNIGPSNTNPPAVGTGISEQTGTGSGAEVNNSNDREATIGTEPVTKDPPPERKFIKSLGVVNGKASYLPKPPYPAPAAAVNAQGKVDVQITIDENGKVISAKAVSGHVLLRQAAEKAALNARFTPTTLSEVPVKVTGVIVYNFTRN